MTVAMEIRKRLPAVFVPLLSISLMAYFGYHLVVGERGLKAWARLNQEISVAKAGFAQIHAERQALERDVGLLSPDHIDRDMLDERARAVLNLVGPNEVVIFNKSAGH